MHYERGSLQRHEELKTLILSQPELVGVSKQEIISMEAEHPLTKKKHAIAQPDLMIVYRCGKGVCKKYIEVKSGSCRRSLQGLTMQLRKINNYLKTRRMDGEVVGVYPVRDKLQLMFL